MRFTTVILSALLAAVLGACAGNKPAPEDKAAELRAVSSVHYALPG